MEHASKPFNLMANFPPTPLPLPFEVFLVEVVELVGVGLQKQKRNH